MHLRVKRCGVARWSGILTPNCGSAKIYCAVATPITKLDWRFSEATRAHSRGSWGLTKTTPHDFEEYFLSGAGRDIRWSERTAHIPRGCSRSMPTATLLYRRSENSSTRRNRRQADCEFDILKWRISTLEKWHMRLCYFLPIDHGTHLRSIVILGAAKNVGLATCSIDWQDLVRCG
jgi:hypothetical protein